MDVNTFRSIFPEFEDAALFSTTQICFYINLGEQQLNATIWGSLLDNGLAYFTAHNLAVAAKRAKVSAAGGVPGSPEGIIASKAVDKVSISYDTQSIALKNGGLYNSTSYGIQFLTLARMVGAKPIQVNGGGDYFGGVFGTGGGIIA
jgi:hypothetical protein